MRPLTQETLSEAQQKIEIADPADRDVDRYLLLCISECDVALDPEAVIVLRDLGYDVSVLSAGKFRPSMVTRDDAIRLVLFDIHSPDGHGLALCSRLRPVWHNPIMAILHGQACEQPIRALAAGADMYMLAPFDNAELGARVEALLRRADFWRWNPGIPSMSRSS